MDWGLKTLGAVPYALVVAALAASSLFDFETELKPDQARLYAFHAEETNVPEARRLRAGGKVNSPLRITSERPVPEKDSATARHRRTRARLTMIVVSEKQRLAVVDGRVVTTGDTLDGMTIGKIEEDRVLLVGGAPVWMYLEEEK